MTHYTFKTKGVCSREIEFDSDGKIITNIRFKGGCHGNSQGVSSLAEGMTAEEIVKRLKGTNCNGRGTSCPDQLARAIEENIINK